MQNRAVPKLTATSLSLQDRNLKTKKKRRDPSTYDKRIGNHVLRFKRPNGWHGCRAVQGTSRANFVGGLFVVAKKTQPAKVSITKFTPRNAKGSTHKTNKFQGSMANPRPRKTQFHFSRNFLMILFEQKTFDKSSIMSNAPCWCCDSQVK